MWALDGRVLNLFRAPGASLHGVLLRVLGSTSIQSPPAFSDRDVCPSRASPNWPVLAAARVPPVATRLPRRRARLRIFVVRCSLPCDPPVGGHSCNGRSYHASIARSVTKDEGKSMLPNDRLGSGSP